MSIVSYLLYLVLEVLRSCDIPFIKEPRLRKKFKYIEIKRKKNFFILQNMNFQKFLNIFHLQINIMIHNFRYLLSVLTVLFFNDIQLFKIKKKKLKYIKIYDEKKSIFEKQLLLFYHFTKKKKNQIYLPCSNL